VTVGPRNDFDAARIDMTIDMTIHAIHAIDAIER
jgi:hypothetical protein